MSKKDRDKNKWNPLSQWMKKNQWTRNKKITRTLSAASCHESFANRLPTNDGPFWIRLDT